MPILRNDIWAAATLAVLLAALNGCGKTEHADSAPAPREANGDALSGRGLLIVEALSAQWDCKPGPADRGGKTVRALLGPSGWGRTNAS